MSARNHPSALEAALFPDNMPCAVALYREVYHSFQDIPGRLARMSPALTDALMSGFAMFALKDPSLLAFDERRRQDAKNLEMIFHIGRVPCDTGMREVLDSIRGAFAKKA